jgi:hypothetical protein
LRCRTAQSVCRVIHAALNVGRAKIDLQPLIQELIMIRRSVVAAVAASTLVMAMGGGSAASAAAKIKSHSNQSNNRTVIAASAHGGAKVGVKVGKPACKSPITAGKGAGVPGNPAKACVTTGGKPDIAVDHAGGNTP